ncbi:hypothetical protein ACWDY4_18710 [Streptomyces olivaceoviridis]
MTIRALVENLAQGALTQAEYDAEPARAELASALGSAPSPEAEAKRASERRHAQPAGGRVVAAIAVVLDHTTAAALYAPKDPFNEAVAAFYVQASGELGDLYAPVLGIPICSWDVPTRW